MRCRRGGFRRGKWGRLLGNLVAGLAGTLLGAVVLECGVRLTLKDRVVMFPRYVTDRRCGDFTIRGNRPGTTYHHTSRDGTWEFRINRQGFRRDADVHLEKPSGVYRVLVLGDSHTLGYEVAQEQTYARVLERYLSTRGKRAEVINAGVAGSGTAEELVFLREEGLRYSPDAVVLGFYANDYLDNVKADLFRLADGRLVVNRTTHIPGVNLLKVVNWTSAGRWLSENSYAFGFVMNSLWEAGKRLLARKVLAGRMSEAAIGSPEAADRSQEELALALLREMYRLCRERRVFFVIADIPAIEEGGQMKPDPRPISSLRPAMLGAQPPIADYLLLSDDALEGQRSTAPLFVPHGQRHVSPYAHSLIGRRLGQVLLAEGEGWGAPAKVGGWGPTPLQVPAGASGGLSQAQRSGGQPGSR